MLEKQGKYKSFVVDANRDAGERPFAGVVGSVILGDHVFIAEVEEKYLVGKLRFGQKQLILHHGLNFTGHFSQSSFSDISLLFSIPLPPIHTLT